MFIGDFQRNSSHSSSSMSDLFTSSQFNDLVDSCGDGPTAGPSRQMLVKPKGRPLAQTRAIETDEDRRSLAFQIVLFHLCSFYEKPIERRERLFRGNHFATQMKRSGWPIFFVCDCRALQSLEGGYECGFVSISGIGFVEVSLSTLIGSDGQIGSGSNGRSFARSDLDFTQISKYSMHKWSTRTGSVSEFAISKRVWRAGIHRQRRIRGRISSQKQVRWMRICREKDRASILRSRVVCQDLPGSDHFGQVEPCQCGELQDGLVRTVGGLSPNANSLELSTPIFAKYDVRIVVFKLSDLFWDGWEYGWARSDSKENRGYVAKFGDRVQRCGRIPWCGRNGDHIDPLDSRQS